MGRQAKLSHLGLVSADTNVGSISLTIHIRHTFTLAQPHTATNYIEISSLAEHKGSPLHVIKIFNTFGECVMTVETKIYSSLQRINILYLVVIIFFIHIRKIFIKYFLIR